MLCELCITKSCEKTGRPCKEVELYMNKIHGIKRASWIRPMVSEHKRKDGRGKYREIPFSAISNNDSDPLYEDFN